MKKRSGFAIIFVLVMTALILLVAVSFQVIASNDLILAKSSCDSMRAFYVANAGIAKKFMQLRSGDTSSIMNETFTLATGKSGTFSVAVTLTQMGFFKTYRLDSTGRYGNVIKRISFTVKQVSFARFGYFSNSENMLIWHATQPVWFVSRDRINGPLHTNDQLNISGDPVFEGPVSSVNSAINYYHGGPPDDDPDFMGSLTLGAPPVTFPNATTMLNDIKTSAQATDGLYLSGDSTITLSQNGSMYVTNSDKKWTNHNIPLPANHSVYVNDGSLNISGVLNGQLTAGTNRNINIVNNLLYNTSPWTGENGGTDMLGLVAQSSVIVSSGAPVNLEIDGYIVALNNSFTVENYDSGLKGTLTIYGGITQNIRGAVGTFNSSTNQKVSGYTKDYNYDIRLADGAPYYFPPATDNDNRIIYRKISWVEY